jgi:hypothetical protein
MNGTTTTQYTTAADADEAARQAAAAMSATTTPPPPPANTSAAQMQALLDLLNGMKDNYIDPYVKALQTSTQFMSDLAALMTAISKATSAGKDSNNVKVDGVAIKVAIQALQDKYSKPENALYTSKLTSNDGSDAALEEANKWATELGLDPATAVKGYFDENGDKRFAVYLDLSPLAKMADAVKGGTPGTTPMTFQEFLDKNGGDVVQGFARYQQYLAELSGAADQNIDLASYNAMLAALDANKTIMQNFSAQILPEKMVKANGQWESMRKLQSAVADQLFQLMDSLMKRIA